MAHTSGSQKDLAQPSSPQCLLWLDLLHAHITFYCALGMRASTDVLCTRLQGIMGVGEMFITSSKDIYPPIGAQLFCPQAQSPEPHREQV